MGNDLVERLGYHQEDQATGKLVLRNPDGPEAATRITELQAQLAEAREALKPFAEIEVPHGASDGTWVARTTFCNTQVTAHSVRRAARAYAGTTKSPPPLSE